MKINLSPLTRMIINFSLFFVFFVAALFWVVISTSRNQILQATSFAAYIAGMPVLERTIAFIDGDKYEQLAQTLDPEDPFFIATQKKFRELRINTDCLYLYSMAPYKEGVHRFIFDGEDPESEGFSPLGSEEDLGDYDASYMLTFKTKQPQFTKMMFQSNWGRLISAYMPVLNSKGEAVGIIGVDFDGEEIHRAVQSGMRKQFIYASAIIFIGMVIYFFLLKGINNQNKEILKMGQKAQAASHAKSIFLARMSHEIRTPMNAVIGMSELAQRDYGTPKCIDYILGIKNAGESLLAIINDILDFSRIESGKMQIIEVPYDMASLLNDVLTIARIKITEKPLELILDIDSNIPSSLNGDSARIRQIVLNLLSNAIKYSEKGFVKLSISGVTVQDNVVRLTFSVEDSGVGIRPENMGSIFLEFSRVDEHRNSNVEGTGLGLAITKSLCRAMGGDITARSEYGKGSIFTATLRQTVNSWHPMGDITSMAATRSGAHCVTFIAPEADVLVVDDFPSNLIVAKGLLSPYKMCIFEASNGLEAMELAQTRSFDLILMDHMMPVMDGIEATTAIRALGGRFAELPIVALTANAVLGMEEFYLKNGFSAYMTKPIDPSELDDLLKNWIPLEKQYSPTEKNEGEALPNVDVTPTIAGLDAAIGLAMVGGSTDSYHELLQVFLKDTESRFDILESFHNEQEENLMSFTTFVHGLKSALANIGATELSRMAANLESAGRIKDTATIQSALPSFQKSLSALLEHISLAVPSIQKNVDDEGETDKAILTECLMELKSALEAFDTEKMDKFLLRLKTFKLAGGTKLSISEIADHILVGDYENAAEVVKSLLV